MTLRFILGRAGSGKTYYCLSAMARLLQEQQASPVLFVLPEQATFIHERMLACDFMPHGYAGGEVVSFSRLAWQAARQAGQAPKPALSEAARTLLMGRILQQRQRELKLFGTALAGHGLSAALVDLAGELLAYHVAPEFLARTAESFEGASQAKLHDLALLYGDYAAALEDYDDLPSGLAFLARAIGEQGFLSGATVFVDGYSSFTPREQAVLAALMRRAARLEIALALDPQALGQVARGPDIFHNCRQSYKKLLDTAQRLNVAVEPPLILNGAAGRFAHNRELALVERHCYPYGGGPAWREKPASLRVMAAANPREEVAAAGREILRLVREQGLRYREISVIARDLAPYEDLLPEVFGELDIPYFADSKKPLLYHPLVELFRAVLEIWSGQAHYRQVFRYFKSGLTPLSAAETDMLENYCLAHGVRHWQWQLEADWKYWRGRNRGEKLEDRAADEPPKKSGSNIERSSGERLAEINSLRRRGAAPLINFLRAAPPADSQLADGPLDTGALFGAIKALFAELDVERTLGEWQQAALAAGRAEEAALHRQALERLTGFWDEAQALLHGCRLEARQLLQLLDAGCAALTLSLIPPGLDQVLVASLERSRNPELRAAIVLGVNADILPKRAAPAPLLADHERAELARAGIELAPDTLARQMAEHYLAYIALTRSHDNLFLTYALNGAQGKAMQPSPLIKRLQRLFPALTVERFGEPLEASALTGGTDSLRALARQLRAARHGVPLPALWRDVYNWYAADERWHKELRRIKEGLDFTPHQGYLNEETRLACYPDVIQSSVSRLEKFNACPFAYFAAYGLSLKPRPVYEITALERGDIFHRALAELSSLLAQGDPSWQELDKEQAAALTARVLEGLLKNVLSGILDSTARYRYLAARLQDTVTATLLLIAEQIRRGRFLPAAWELPFGNRPGDTLPPLTVELANGRKLEINGQIDRVDVARSSSAAYARIVDYKSGKQTLYQADIISGLRLQLLVYLETVLDNPGFFQAGSLKPAGIYYMTVADELSSVPMPPAGAKNTPAGLRLSGLSIKDSLAVRLADPQINGHSKLIPVALSANGFYANSPGLTAEEFLELRGRLKDILRQTAQSMTNGLTAVAPQRSANFDACAYCDYRGLCGFDGEGKRAIND